MEDTCRACLKTGHSQRWFSLYEEPLKSMFYECTFVKVKPTEQFPYNLCSLCVALCDAAYNFREMCENHDRKIRMGDFQLQVSTPKPVVVSTPKPVIVSPPKPVVVSPPPLNTDTIIEKPASPESLQEMMGEEVPETIEEIISEEEQGEEVVTEDVDQITEIIIATEYETEDQPNTTNQDEESSEEHGYTVENVVEPTVATNCQFCLDTFSNKISLLDHYAEQHQEETYNCAGCNQLFYTLNEWRSHMCRRPVKGKVSYVCPFCSEVSSHRRNFAAHLAEKHPDMQYPCDKCDKHFVKAETWRTHLCKGDASEFVCNYCDASFGFQAQLTRHVKTHMSQPVAADKQRNKYTYKNRKVPCTICEATFHSKFYLTQHMMVHTGDLPYSCPLCERQFRNKCNLLRHIRSVHKEKSFKFSDIK